MSQTATRCPKCSGDMVQGFMLDSRLNVVSYWAEGTPQLSFLGGYKIPEGKLAIATLRCQSCGLLESYAQEESPAVG
jgi:hypothetical protein